MALKPASLQWSDDGALRSLDFGDIYFQRGQGLAESHYVFLEKNRLQERFGAAQNGFHIAELGFGTGLNFLLTAQMWQKAAPASARLTYVSIEKHPIQALDLKRIHGFWPELRPYAAELQEQYPPPLAGFHTLYFLKSRIRLILLYGDVAKTLPELTGSFDAWYLDGFSPAKNPAMWEEKLFPLIAARTKPGGTLATFSSAGSVRRGLQSVGFTVEKVTGFGVKRDMTVARMEGAAQSPDRKSIAVLGAGIAGASAAFALAEKGCDVTVFDRHPAAAGETSGNPVGVIYPKLTVDASPLGVFHQHAFCLTRNLVTSLNLPSWNPCGVAHLDLNDEDRKRHLALSLQEYPEDYLKYEETPLGQGLFQPGAGYLSPPEFCRALLDHPKITTRYMTEISTLNAFEHDAIVLALGYETKKFSETAWLPLQNLRGQISYLKPKVKDLSHVYCHEGYITPVVDGLHYIGATFQREEPAPLDLRDIDHRENLTKLNINLPRLGFSAADIVGGRAGYRTALADKLPVIGPTPDYAAFMASKRAPLKLLEKIYLSTGYSAYGMSGAPLAGEIIAAQITGDPLPTPVSLMEYLAPERFILRDLKRGRI